MRMNNDDIHPLRAGRGFFSKMLLGMRRLAALTRSPVPIAWMADGRARAKSHDLGRWMGRLTLPAERGSPGWQHPRTLRRPAGQESRAPFRLVLAWSRCQDAARWLLDLVGCGFLVVGGWRLSVGRLNCSRHARFAFACPSSRKKSLHFRPTQTFGPACRVSSRLEPWATLRSRQL